MESLREGWGEGLGRPMSRDLLPRTRAGLDGRFPKGCDDPTAACFGFNAPIQTCLKQPQPWRWWGCGSRNRPCWFGFLQAISFAARHTASLHHHRNPGVSAQAAGPTGAGGHWPELSAGCGPRRLCRSAEIENGVPPCVCLALTPKLHELLDLGSLHCQKAGCYSAGKFGGCGVRVETMHSARHSYSSFAATTASSTTAAAAAASPRQLARQVQTHSVSHSQLSDGCSRLPAAAALLPVPAASHSADSVSP